MIRWRRGLWRSDTAGMLAALTLGLVVALVVSLILR